MHFKLHTAVMKRQFGRQVILGSLGVLVLLASIGTSMANVVLPMIASDFRESFSAVKWVVLSYLLATTVFSLMVGRFGDLKGRRKTLIWGTTVFIAGTGLSAVAPSFPLLILARVLQGLGGAALVVLPMAIVTEVISREKMGRAIGWLATMSAIGTAAGPSVGGFLLGESGWRASFSFVAGLGFLSLISLIVVVPAGGALKEDRSRKESLLAALISLSGDSLMRIRLTSNFVVSAVMMSTLIAGPFYLTRVLKVAPAEMGLVMSAGPLASIVFGLFSGVLADRFGFFRILKFGFIQLFIGTVSFAIFPQALSSVGFALSAVLLSLGYQLFLSANSSCIMKNVAAERKGLVSGALSLSRNLGLMAGTDVMGGIFEIFGLEATFIVCAVLVAISMALQLKVQRKADARDGEVSFAGNRAPDSGRRFGRKDDLFSGA